MWFLVKVYVLRWYVPYNFYLVLVSLVNPVILGDTCAKHCFVLWDIGRYATLKLLAEYLRIKTIIKCMAERRENSVNGH